MRGRSSIKPLTWKYLWCLHSHILQTNSHLQRVRGTYLGKNGLAAKMCHLFHNDCCGPQCISLRIGQNLPDLTCCSLLSADVTTGTSSNLWFSFASKPFSFGVHTTADSAALDETDPLKKGQAMFDTKDLRLIFKVI